LTKLCASDSVSGAAGSETMAWDQPRSTCDNVRITSKQIEKNERSMAFTSSAFAVNANG
jgi:hypothetical protein